MALLCRHCRFLLFFILDGHNGTVHISSASYSCGGYISTSALVDHTDGHIDSLCRLHSMLPWTSILISWLIVLCSIVASFRPSAVAAAGLSFVLHNLAPVSTGLLSLLALSVVEAKPFYLSGHRSPC
jgi:hypothetical protein